MQLALWRGRPSSRNYPQSSPNGKFHDRLHLYLTRYFGIFLIAC